MTTRMRVVNIQKRGTMTIARCMRGQVSTLSMPDCMHKTIVEGFEKCKLVKKHDKHSKSCGGVYRQENLDK